MIQESVLPAIMEFSLRCREMSGLRTAVLFGSAATGTLTKKSDIDILLLFDTRGNPETGKESDIVHRIGGAISDKFGLPYPFSFVMYGKEEPVEPSLLREVMREGIVLFARAGDVLSIPKRTLKPYVLVSYTLKGMRPKEKMALQRGLYGYKIERKIGKKIYRNSKPGLVGEAGRRIGPTAFLLRNEKAEAMRNLFRENKCRYTEVPIWLEG